MKNILTSIFLILNSFASFAQGKAVSLHYDHEGVRLKVNGDDFFINGMNWDYTPRGTNYEYSLWEESDEFIIKALESEMSLLKEIGVNVLRQYLGIPSKWIQYIYEEYGIYTMLNHSFGRYGLAINETWIPNTDYSDRMTREVLLSETTQMIKEYKGTPGLLMYLLGNENNYGLFWEGGETEDFPDGSIEGRCRARDMYRLFNEAVIYMKTIDSNIPIAICNGDLLYSDIIAEECKDIDILGLNIYRGASFGDAFSKARKLWNKPLMFTEFGSDAFNSMLGQEDQEMQAHYLIENWKEIYQNAAGLGLSQSTIGGFTFQFSDGWWKNGQTIDLNIHNNTATWKNGGYNIDYDSIQNNMNEEWFGVCAKGPTDKNGFYTLNPRLAFYALKEIHLFNPYDYGVSMDKLDMHFNNIRRKTY